MIDPHIYLLAETSQNFDTSIEAIQSMPNFFSDALDWGISASYKALGFMTALVLGISMFKR